MMLSAQFPRLTGAVQTAVGVAKVNLVHTMKRLVSGPSQDEQAAGIIKSLVQKIPVSMLRDNRSVLVRNAVTDARGLLNQLTLDGDDQSELNTALREAEGLEWHNLEHFSGDTTAKQRHRDDELLALGHLNRLSGYFMGEAQFGRLSRGLFLGFAAVAGAVAVATYLEDSKHPQVPQHEILPLRPFGDHAGGKI